MLNRYAEICEQSPLQRALLDIFESSGSSRGMLITLSVQSLTTSEVVELRVPGGVTGKEFVDALAMADKEATLIPSSMIKDSAGLVRSRTHEPLGPNIPLVHYNLESGEMLEIFFQQRLNRDWPEERDWQRSADRGGEHWMDNIHRSWLLSGVGVALGLGLAVIGVAIYSTFMSAPASGAWLGLLIMIGIGLIAGGLIYVGVVLQLTGGIDLSRLRKFVGRTHPSALNGPYPASSAPPAPQPHVSARPEGMHCSNCRTVARSGARFCRNCGRPLEPGHRPRYCRHCGARLRERARFCPRCGKPVRVGS